MFDLLWTKIKFVIEGHMPAEFLAEIDEEWRAHKRFLS